MTDAERISRLEQLVLYLFAFQFRQSKMFLSPMADGRVGKEIYELFKEELKKPPEAQK